MSLINDILDLSKIESGNISLNLQAVSIRTIISDIQSIFIPEVTKNSVTFVVDISDEIPESLLTDELRLRQIILNIAGNAVKFTKSGSVTITVDCNQSEQNECVNLEIRISDTGKGIVQEDLETFFAPFQQATGQSYIEYGDTGLGLAICARVVTVMNGEIGLKSELGTGSTFTIALGNVEVPATNDKPNIVVNEDVIPDIGHITAIIVDDVKESQSLLKAYLDKANVTVHLADDGKTAIQLARIIKPD